MKWQCDVSLSVCLSVCVCAEAATQFLTKMLAGLAGSPHLISGTVLSLSRLVYEFHGKHVIECQQHLRPTEVHLVAVTVLLA